MIKDVIVELYKYIKRKVRGIKMNNKIEELRELLTEYGIYPKKEEPKKTNPLIIVLAVLGAIAAVGTIAYAVFYFFCPEDSEYFEDFDEDEFEDDDLEGDE